jgi:hypothetical protein
MNLRKSIAIIFPRRGNRCSLSLEERAGVRTGFLILFTIFGFTGSEGKGMRKTRFLKEAQGLKARNTVNRFFP